jgi:hypothetical protein
MHKADKRRGSCGLVMPISAIEGCDSSHWSEVRSILIEVATNSGFDCKLVSEEAEVGVLHRRIITNLVENDLIICDVSCKNPNVMLELGMRLAFDKPAVIVKDDVTDFSFDTSPIEHVIYRRDLRFNSIVEFKKQLSEKIIATVGKRQESGFLASFGLQIASTKLPKEAASNSNAEVIAELRKLSVQVSELRNQEKDKNPSGRKNLRVTSMKLMKEINSIRVICGGPTGDVSLFFNALSALVGVKEVSESYHGSFRRADILVEPGVDIENFFYQLIFTIRPDQVL